MEGARDETLRELRNRADGEGVATLLVMVDDEGDLSHPNARARKKATRNHRKWVDAVALLGGRAIRVNTGGEKTLTSRAQREAPDSPALRDPILRCAESCANLAQYALPAGVSVLLENHGGLSANVPALVRVVETVAMENVGTLPDFGNPTRRVDSYDAVRMMLPLAQAVSAKTFDFDENGMETTIDFSRMLDLLREAGYEGHLGIEYEGNRLSEAEGIRRSKELIERLVN
jgi:sugar phosphate isomerase/epimerase